MPAVVLGESSVPADKVRYGGPGAAVLAKLRTLALNLLSLHRPAMGGSWSGGRGPRHRKLHGMVGIEPEWAIRGIFNSPLESRQTAPS